MKTKVIITGLILAFTFFSAHAQVQTLVLSPTSTESAVINVASNSYAVIKSFSANSGGNLVLNIQGVTFTLNLPFQSANGLTFSGPATIQLQGAMNTPAFVTVDVEPGPFPLDKTLTLGAYSGNVQVTMQVSTDLVNWTPAVNGMVYTNVPDARFFRIQLLTNVQGP